MTLITVTDSNHAIFTGYTTIGQCETRKKAQKMGRKSDLSPKFPVSKLIVCSLGPHFYFDVHIGLPLNTHNVLIILISNRDTEAHADQ